MPRRSKKGSRKSNRNRNEGYIITVHGKGSLAAASTTNASGLFVVTTYEIDTDMLAVWQQYANLYQKWRVLWIRFTHNPIQSSATPGTVAMSVQEDPYGTPPATLGQCLENRVATATVHYRKQTLTWRPHRSQRWLFTKELVTVDDRDEFPGDFIYCTTSFNVATNPGFITLEYMLEFTDMCNSGTALVRQPSLRKIRPLGAEPSPTSITEVQIKEETSKPLVGPQVAPKSEIIDLFAELTARLEQLSNQVKALSGTG
jgi:hypothetical protein